MKLIRLAPIAILHSQAKADRDKALRVILVPSPENSEISDSHFAHLIKTHAQAKVIYKNLKKLHRVCTDFVAGNFQPYIDKHTEYQKTIAKNPENLPDAEYEPFGELDVLFNIMCDFPLPKEIEQFRGILYNWYITFISNHNLLKISYLQA